MIILFAKENRFPILQSTRDVHFTNGILHGFHVLWKKTQKGYNLYCKTLSCGKTQEAYRLQCNLSKPNCPGGGGGEGNPCRGLGYPATWDWGTPPHLRLGYPPGRDQRPVTEVPPPPPVDRQKDRYRWKHYLPVILITWAVITTSAILLGLSFKRFRYQ